MRAKKVNESILRFSDEMEFDTSGPLRAVRKSDGWYIVGQGLLIPVKDEEEANDFILHFKEFNRPTNLPWRNKK